MTLSFSQKFPNGSETNFVPKIWRSLFLLDEEKYYYSSQPLYYECNVRELVNGNTFIQLFL